jgi:hypothetical protein
MAHAHPVLWQINNGAANVCSCVLDSGYFTVMRLNVFMTANGYAYREATAQIRKYRQTDYRKKDLNMHVEMILISKRL